MKIIAISGKKQSGKDTAAAIIAELLLNQPGSNYYPVPKKFAYGLKVAAARILMCDVEDFESEEEKSKPAAPWLDPSMTKRKFLQLLGTEIGHHIDPEIWIKRELYNLEHAIFLARLGTPVYIFTDIRFPLEANRLLTMGADLIRIHDPNPREEDTAPSEIALDNYAFPTVLVNDKTSLDKYKAQLHSFLVAKNYITEKNDLSRSSV
jgi:hypothetical protein